MNVSHRLLQALLYSNIWIALSAAAQVYLGMRLLGLESQPQPCLLAFCSMFWVYTFAKAVHFDPQADGINDPERTEFLLTYRVPLVSFGLVCLIYGLQATYYHNALAFIAFITPTLAGLVYDLKLLPAQFTYRRLKDIPGVKGLTVALAWGLMPGGLIQAYTPQAPTSGLVAFTLWATTMWFVNTTYFDLGDIRGDRVEGTRTLPIVLGYATTRRLLHLLNLGALVLMVLTTHQGIAVAGRGWIAMVGLYQWFLLYRARGEETDLQWECDVFADGVMIFAAICVLCI
jgi:4-hydroxybenzoate polyprenyltransferase